METCDFLIIGAGIAGASVAFELAPHGRVIVLEREAVPGHHSTGRSAAVLTQNYGNSIIRRLTLATRPFLEHPPDGFTEYPLTAPRRMLWIAREDQKAGLEATLDEAQRLVPTIRAVAPAEAYTLCSALRAGYVAYAILEPHALDLDVHAIHQGFLRGLRNRGGTVVTNAEVVRFRQTDASWEVQTPDQQYAAAVVVNAAGAWCDVIGQLAGARPVGLVPKRRTAFTCSGPAGIPPEELAAWPVIIDSDEDFYFKPESGGILASPADETPMDPCDVFPDDYDVAVAIDRIQKATTLSIAHINRRWAGLRSFVPDKTPVVGMDSERAGFFWLAGQGGYGIQTSSAMGRTAASLIVNQHLPQDVTDMGLTPEDLAPIRVQAERD
jgi:D-arginine dehydrogenase